MAVRFYRTAPGGLSGQQVLAALLELFAVDLTAGEPLLEDHQRAVVPDFLNDRRDDEVDDQPGGSREEDEPEQQEYDPAEWEKFHPRLLQDAEDWDQAVSIGWSRWISQHEQNEHDPDPD